MYFFIAFTLAGRNFYKFSRLPCLSVNIKYNSFLIKLFRLVYLRYQISHLRAKKMKSIYTLQS